MGFPTQVKWVWAAMNPLSYSATNALDEALVGRFALFLYPPTLLEMEEDDRIRVARHINGDDAPALATWTQGTTGRTVAPVDMETVGQSLGRCLEIAGQRFLQLQNNLTTLPKFLAKFATLLVQESNGKLELDGRRLGFIYRNLLACRAVELAKAELGLSPAAAFTSSAKHVIKASIPVGLSDENEERDDAAHVIEICFDLLSRYFEEGAELETVNLIYELFTTWDLIRKAELLLNYDLGEFAKSKAWTDLMNEKWDLTILAYTALQVEARKPCSVPQELLASLSAEIQIKNLSSECLAYLHDDNIEYVEAIEALLDRTSDLERLVAYDHVSRLAKCSSITPEKIQGIRELIESDIERLEALLSAKSKKGGQAA